MRTQQHSAIGTFAVAESPEAFPLLPALAQRLGVKPGEGGGRVMLTMKDGTGYDLFALINAFLDRVDAATQPLDKFNQTDANQAGS